MIGSMRDRITFLEQVNTPVPGGGAETSWQTAFDTWALAVQPSGYRELPDSQVELYARTYFIIRDEVGQQPNKRMLVEHDGIQYTIHRIKPGAHGQKMDFRHRYLTVYTEGVYSEMTQPTM